MKNFVLSLLCGAVAVVLLGNDAQARSQYSKIFAAEYNLKKPSTDAEKSLAAAVKKYKKCNVCHSIKKNEKGKASKKNRNSYGESIKKLLKKYDAKRFKNDKEKVTQEVVDALKKVAKEKSPTGKTFGELLKAGKLPHEEKADEKAKK